MFCPIGGQAIAFIKEVPSIIAEGGAIIFTTKSGQQIMQYAYPMWLARIVCKQVSTIIAEQDANKTP